MSAPALSTKLPLYKLRRHVRHTLLKLRTRAWGRAAGAPLETLLKEVDTALAEESKQLDALEDAETAADIADLELDACARLAWNVTTLHFLGQSRSEVREALFGRAYLSEFTRPALGPKLRAMRTWPRYLLTLTAVDLKALVARVEAALKAADAATAGALQAEIDLTAFRSGTQAPLVKKVDLQLQAVFAEARKQARTTGVVTEEKGLFLVPRRRQTLTLTPARARAAVASWEQGLAEARADLAQVEAQAQAEAKAEKEREALRQRITTLKGEQAAKQTEIAALEDELNKKR